MSCNLKINIKIWPQFFTFLPFMSHVMCGAGFARVVVQLAISFSPTTKSRFLNMIFGGPVCLTMNERERKREKINKIIRSHVLSTQTGNEKRVSLTKKINSSCTYYMDVLFFRRFRKDGIFYRNFAKICS